MHNRLTGLGILNNQQYFVNVALLSPFLSVNRLQINYILDIGVYKDLADNFQLSASLAQRQLSVQFVDVIGGSVPRQFVDDWRGNGKNPCIIKLNRWGWIGKMGDYI